MIDPAPIQARAAEQFSSIRAGIVAFMNSLPASVTPTSGDLILGFATGYKPHMIAPFVESLRLHGQFAGKIVLFVDPAVRKMANYLRDKDIEAIAFDLSRSPVNSLLIARFFAYFDYLREQWDSGAIFSQILLTDVRDVIFQKALFGTPCEELEFYLEGSSHIGAPSLIGEDRFTSRWLEIACGEQVLETLLSRTVSCAGTVSGRALGIFGYLAQMQLLAMGLSEVALSTKWGIDQALHNYILYTGLTRSVSSKPNFARVATLGVIHGNTLTCDAKGRIVNPNGQISEIAHQWDRHRHLAKAICSSYLKNREYGIWRSWMARTLPVLTLSTWSHLLRLAKIGLSRVA
jgi:hypothetical protein